MRDKIRDDFVFKTVYFQPATKNQQLKPMISFDFTKEIILENDFVLLRALTPDDFENLLYFSLNEPDTWKYSAVQARGEEGLKNYLAKAFEAKAAKTAYPFIVYDKRVKKYAGSTRYYSIDVVNNTLHIGSTWYGKEFQGTGLNKHCKLLLLQYAFENLNVERVEFRADSTNERSIAAMKSIGCVVEGILRQDLNPNSIGQKRRSSIILSILKDEWFDGVKENLFKKSMKYEV